MGEIPAATNTNSGDNPDYAISNFTADFPQFQTVCAGTSPTIPTAVTQKFIDMANESLSYRKYGSAWSLCMGLYVAHFCTMYLNASPTSTTSQGIVGHAKPTLLQTSKSVGDVSASYDAGSINDDLKNFGSFKMTTYGQQLATFVKMAGMGGMYVW